METFLLALDDSGRLSVRRECSLNAAAHFSAGASPVHAAQLVPAHRAIAALPANKPFLLFSQLNKPKLTKKLNLDGKVELFRVSPNGHLVAIASGSQIQLFDFFSHTLLHTITHHFKNVTCLEFSPDSAYLVSGGADAQLLAHKIHDLLSDEAHDEATRLQKFSGHQNAIAQVCLGFGGVLGKLYSSGADSSIKVWDFKTGVLIQSLSLDSPALCFSLDAIERTLFYCNHLGKLVKKDLLFQHKLENKSEDFECFSPKPITKMVISSNSNFLFTMSDNHVSQYDTNTLHLLKTINFSHRVSHIEGLEIEKSFFENEPKCDFLTTNASNVHSALVLPQVKPPKLVPLKSVSHDF